MMLMMHHSWGEEGLAMYIEENGMVWYVPDFP
jgi:hypothetical protein